MPKKKKKKGGDKDKKARRKSGVNERETVFFEQQIQDNNRQLARLRSRNDYLESELERLQGKLIRLEDDRADVVAHLKRILQQKTEEARELGERLQAMEELRRDEQIAYKAKEDSMKQEYHNMETNLNAEVKLVAGKLNALEDWKNARAELTQKFEIQEQQMAEQEERHAKTLYEAEKSLIIGKAKMQKEMEERLNELALKFQEATNIRIADATHRAIRENIALHLELDTTLKNCQDLEERIEICKEKEENARLRASLYEKEAQMAVNKVLQQNRIIETLAEEHINAARERSNNRHFETYALRKEEMIKSHEKRYSDTQKKSELLEKNIRQAEETVESTMEEIEKNHRKIKKLNDVLELVKKLISELPMTSTTVEPGVCACDPNFREKLLRIYEIFENFDTISIETM